ncbi:MAG: flagellar protein FlaG [Nitrospiraceae bacterium]|nr:flagellar protein FlaG [Nitrospira sp.]MCB9775144.1 flagellar protein FlaG [Nitrospiraceae bacterium]MCW5781739.1 flagellar protein FlaG [Nitrospirales bacterium]
MRDGQKPITGDVQRISALPPPVFATKSSKDPTVKDPLTKDQVQASVARLQETLKQVDPRIEISLEKDINQVIFRVVDKESGELIRQIPSEKAVELARLFSGHSGLLVEENI